MKNIITALSNAFSFAVPSLVYADQATSNKKCEGSK